MGENGKPCIHLEEKQATRARQRIVQTETRICIGEVGRDWVAVVTVAMEMEKMISRCYLAKCQFIWMLYNRNVTLIG